MAGMSFARYVVMICDCDQVMLSTGEAIASTCHRENSADTVKEALAQAKKSNWGVHRINNQTMHLCPTHEADFIQSRSSALASITNHPTIAALSVLPDPEAGDLEDLEEVV